MKRAAVAVVLALLTSLAAGCTGDEGDKVATSSCGRVLYEGEGKPVLVGVLDELPLIGKGAVVVPGELSQHQPAGFPHA